MWHPPPPFRLVRKLLCLFKKKHNLVVTFNTKKTNLTTIFKFLQAFILPIPIIVIFSQIKINLGYNSFFSSMYVTTNQKNRLTQKKIACHIYEIATGIYVNTHTFTPNPYCNILTNKERLRWKFIFVLAYMLLHIR